MVYLDTVVDAWEVTTTRMLTAFAAPDDHRMRATVLHCIGAEPCTGESTFGASRICFILLHRCHRGKLSFKYPRAQTRLRCKGDATMTEAALSVAALRLSWVLASTTSQ